MKRSFFRAVIALMFLCVPGMASSFADDLEKGLARDLQKSRVIVLKAAAKLKSGGNPAVEIAQLKSVAESIRAAHLLMEERFRTGRDKASSLGGKAAERQNAVATAYINAVDAYLAQIDAIPPDDTVTSSTLDSFKDLLDQIVKSRTRPLLGTLPYRHLNYPAREPALSPAVVPAYKGGNGAVTPADTAASAEAPISKDISDLAQSLSWNPVLIYEWVKNNVETEWYWGVMKGAEETLRQKSGNDADQAALLVALLRASGYPSRFVKGTIEFFPDIDKVKNLTGLTDPTQIAAFFRKAGIAFKPVIAGGGIANFQVEHIWVESRIPYANYRGAVIDDQGKTWLGLDTSIKPLGYTRNAPLDVPADVTAQVRDDYLAANQEKSPLEFLQGKVKGYLDVHQPGKAWQDVLSARTLSPDVLKIIPGSLQFKQLAITGEYTELPGELRHQVKFTARSNGNELFAITLDSLKLSNKRVTLTYEPETVEDQQIIDSYGGLDNSPSYLVRLRPVLTVDGERQVVARDGLPMGADYTLTIDVITPNGTETITSAQITGNLTAIGIVGGKAAAPGPVADSDDAETLLHKEAVSYIDRWNRAEDELAAFYRVAPIRPVPTVVIVGGLIDVTYLLDVPHGFQWKGVFIDAALRGIEVTGASGEGWREKEFMRLSSLQGSILENRIFEDDFKVESISTAKLMQLAAMDGTPLVSMDKTNVDTVLPALPFDDNVKADIANAVNQGLTVTIPQTEIGYQDWTGIGYVKENPDTGEAGWMLTGMVAGGMSVVGIDRWNEIFKDGLMQPFSEPPNRDPGSAFSIQKITATDLQFGEVGEKTDDPLQVIVKDKSGKPVPDVSVTFTILAGGGSFADGAKTVTVKTGGKGATAGVASATPVLGRKTGDNPTYFIEEDDTYSSQYGVNIINASMESGTEITAPFTAYGVPKTAVNLRKTNGDEKVALVLTYVGFVGLVVEDEYGNPISNQPVTFSVGNVKDNSGCTKDAKDTRPAVLIKGGDSCLDNFLTYSGAEKCNPAAQSMDVISDHQGASVGVLLGGMPGSVYPVVANAIVETESGEKELSATFNLQTFAFSRCGGDKPRYALFTTYVYPSDMYGNNINAGRTDTEVTLKAKMYYIKEDEITFKNSMACDGFTLTCDNWIKGAGTFHDYTDIKKPTLTFGDLPGNYQDNGEFTATYKLQRGINNITITGKADIGYHVNVNNCQDGCQPLDERTDSPTSTPVVMQLYGVDIEVKQPLQVALTPDGYSRNNLKIAYTIAPADYQAVSADILIFKGDEVIDYLLSETEGDGFGTIARGYKFDPTASYFAEVVLNYGMGNKISSGKVPINIVKGFLVTDYNHNRKIDQEDIDQALNGEIYNFWVNDDDDNGDTDGSDIPDSGSNGTSEKISGVRDLIDYFPVQLDIKDLLSKNDPSQSIYKLSCDKENVNYVIPPLNVDPPLILLSSRSGEYLTGNDTDLNLAVGLVDVKKTLVPKEGTALPADFLAMLQSANDSDHGVILLDGRSVGKCNLKLSVVKDGKTVFESTPLVINLGGVEDMFRHKNLTQDGVITEGPNSQNKDDFAPGLNSDNGVPDRLDVANPPNSEGQKNFVFVHGYNVNGNKARGWQSEMFKRMYWSGSKAKFWGVTWYGWYSQILNTVSPNYWRNVRQAIQTGPALKEFLGTLGGDITIAGHSMGTVLVSSAIKDSGAVVNRYYMLNAAIPTEAFYSAEPEDSAMLVTDWDGYSHRLRASDWYTLFPTDDRSKLTWRDRFTNDQMSIIYNFFSPGEDVLSGVWRTQERVKGTLNLFGIYYGGWGFNLSDYFVSTPPRTDLSPWPPERADTLTDKQLRTKPFFKNGGPFDELTVDGVIDGAIVNNYRDRVLAEAIPALTPAVGMKTNGGFLKDFNIDMQNTMKTKKNDAVYWPSSRGDDKRWKHSDIRNVAYPFVYSVFETLTSGGLK